MLKFLSKDNKLVREIILKVLEIERVKEFYTKIVSPKVLESKEKRITFTTNGINPVLTIAKPNDVVLKLSRRTGLYHFTLLLPKRKD